MSPTGYPDYPTSLTQRLQFMVFNPPLKAQSVKTPKEAN